MQLMHISIAGIIIIIIIILFGVGAHAAEALTIQEAQVSTAGGGEEL